MLLKLGVDISRLNREIRRTLNFIDKIFKAGSVDEATITSTYEGNHMPSSLHYKNDAYDVRPPTFEADFVYQEIKDQLGKDFDVVPKAGHIHIEYDPK